MVGQNTKEHIRNIHQLFVNKVREDENCIAVRFHGNSITYGELEEKSNRYANYLKYMGVSKNNHVGIILNRSTDMIAVLLAILKCAAVYVPMEPDYPTNRIKYILENAGIKLVVTEKLYNDLQVSCILLEELKSKATDTESLCGIKDWEELAYIIYTSGSSGQPKGVMIPHKGVMNLIHWVNQTYQVMKADKLLCVTSVCFDLSVYDIFGILAAGGTIVLADKEEIKNRNTLTEIIVKEGITFWNSVPTTLAGLAEHLCCLKNFNQNNLRLVFLSGDWIPVSLPDNIKKFFPNASVISLGGATEASVWSIYYEIEETNSAWASIPYGKPIWETCFYILDSDKNPVPKGEPGELYIGSTGLAKGYINDREKTENAFMNDPFSSLWNNMYKTGDLGREMEDGNIEFLGRLDDQVKIRGYRIEVKEIEKCLMEFYGIKIALVVPQNNPMREKYLCAYLTVNRDFELTTLKAYLKTNLPEYMLPSLYVKLEEFPLNENGKIDKKALPSPELELILTTTDYTQPEDIEEVQIKVLWEKVLGITGIGIKYDFFEIGGTSLDAAALEGELQQAGLILRYGEIVSNPTIQQQAVILKQKYINNSVKEIKTSSVVEKNHRGEIWIGGRKLKPFNRLFYKSCFYHSLFPVVEYYGKDINAFFAQDLFFYQLENGNSLTSLAVETKSWEGILEEMGIAVESRYDIPDDILAAELEKAFESNTFVILYVDTYYEPIRRDTYYRKHLPHTLLVWGKEDGGYQVLEHSHKDALNYRKHLLKEDALIQMYKSYREYYPDLYFSQPSVIKLWHPGYRRGNIEIRQEKEKGPDYCNKVLRLYQDSKEKLKDSMACLKEFIANYRNTWEMKWSDGDNALIEEIQGINGILDHKRTVKFQLERILPDRIELQEQAGELVSAWEEIRNDFIKYGKKNNTCQSFIDRHDSLLDKIVLLEKEINQELLKERGFEKHGG